MSHTEGKRWGAVSDPRHDSLRFRENLLKGQMAEAIVEQLVAAHGYRILPYGVEKRFPGWINDQNAEPTPAHRQMRAAPDFVVEVPAEDGRTRLHYLEVKFASDGAPWREDLGKYRDYPDTILVVVNATGVRAHYVADYYHGEPLLPILEFAPFPLEHETVEHFARIVRQMFDWEWEETVEPGAGEEGVGVMG